VSSGQFLQKRPIIFRKRAPSLMVLVRDMTLNNTRMCTVCRRPVGYLFFNRSFSAKEPYQFSAKEPYHLVHKSPTIFRKRASSLLVFLREMMLNSTRMCTGCRRPIGCLVLIGHSPPRSLIIFCKRALSFVFCGK